MPINRVVLNASPLIGLFKSGLVDLIPALFQDIVVPEAVIKEVMAEADRFDLLFGARKESRR